MIKYLKQSIVWYWQFLLMICQLGFSLSVDYASFRYAKNVNLVELYYSIPYRDLIYYTQNDTILADVRIDYSIHSFFSPDSAVDSVFRHLSLPSFNLAQQRDLTMLDQIVFYARPGKYWLNFTVSNPNPERPDQIGFFSDTLEIRDFADSLNLSDIELVAKFARDTTEGRFSKGGLRVMPNPSGQFGVAYDLVNVYLEVYNMVADTFPFEVVYAVLDSNRTPVKTFPTEKRRKSGSSISLTFAIDAKELIPGGYFLFVRVCDLSTLKEVNQYKRFSIVNPETSIKHLAFRSLGPEERRYYEMIHFFATEKEQRQFKKLSSQGREKFLEQFWTKHDFPEFLARIKYADAHFGFGRKPGRETDRGKMYIKYGPPDEIEDLPMIENTKPQQKWRYYKRGLILIFVDIYSNGNPQFIYSNSRDDVNHPDWEKYVNPEEVRE